MTTELSVGGLGMTPALEKALPHLPGGKLIDKPGVYEVPHWVYHVDPVRIPSLSSTTVRAAIDGSMWHAWHQHPRLNPRYTPKQKDKFDLGSAAHEIMLLDGGRLKVIDAPDYKTKAAQLAKAEARLAHDIPILAHQLDAATDMAHAGFKQIRSSEQHSHAFSPESGKSEVMIVWQELNGVWCRALLDFLVTPEEKAEFLTIYDYKRTESSAQKPKFTRHAQSMGYDIQDAFHSRGASVVFGVPEDNVHFWLVPHEAYPPYALNFLNFCEDDRDRAREQIDYIYQVWAGCMMHDVWPGYPMTGERMELPKYAHTDWQEARAVGQWEPRMLEQAMAAYAPRQLPAPDASAKEPTAALAASLADMD